MKKTLFFLALSCTQFSFSQYYNLSDSNFRNWIKTRYQSINPSIIVGNGLDTSIAKTIGNLSFKLINESTITNVDGIQFFYLTSFELRNTKVKSISNIIFGPINGSRLDTFSIMNNDSLASINVQIALNSSNQLPTYRKIENNKNLILIDTLLMTGGDLGGGGSTRIYNNAKLQKINFIDFQTTIIDTNAMLDTIKRIGNLNTTGIYIYKNVALRYIGDIKISADNTDIVSINDNKELNYLGDISGFTTIQNVANYLFGISLDKNPKLVTLKKLPLVSEICFISNMMGLTKITSLQKRIKMELKLENIPLLDSVLVNYPDTANSISLINLGVKKISNFPTICNDITVRNCKALLSNTGIPEFPIFKNNVQIYLEYLNISSIPTLVAQTKNIRIDMMNHPNFKCLPVLMEMYNFNFDTNVIKCFPNFVSTTPSKGLPLCSGSNPNGCGIYDNISGKVFNEKNSNCNQDAGELNAYKIPVLLFKKNVLTHKVWTNQSGMYSFKTIGYDTFTHKIDTVGLPFNITCPAGGRHTSIITAIDSVKSGKDFGITCKNTNAYDLGTDYFLSSFIFPGNLFHVYFNSGDLSNLINHIKCYTSSLAGSVSLEWVGPIKYDTTYSPTTPDSTFANRVTYKIANFENAIGEFDIRFKTDTSAKLNDTVYFTVRVNPTTLDINPSNNVLTRKSVVNNSFDPNKKSVYPSGNLNIDNMPKEMVYTVYFQNTGNAPAQNIYITDLIDSKLDINSIRILGSSHQGAPSINYEQNLMRMDFKNIVLPDSVNNEPASHGWMQYIIKLKSGLQLNDEIKNTASIYFDFNSPIQTNTVISKITKSSIPSSIVSIGNIFYNIYPNPTTGSINIEGDNLPQYIIVSDILSRVVEVIKPTEKNTSVHLSSKGVYFISIIKDGEKQIQRIIFE